MNANPKTKQKSKRKSLRKKFNETSDNPTVGYIRDEQNTVSCRLPTLSSQFTCRVMTTTGALVTASASSSTSNSYYFSLNDIDETTAYTGLFDQYRIDAIVFRIIPMQNAIGLTTNSTTTPVRFYSVIDYDDAGTLATEAIARAYESCVITAPGMPTTRVFKPRMALAAYQGTFAGYANMADQWCDTNSTGIQFYGVKTFIPQATAAQTQLQSWTIERDYYISFRRIHG
jgi:hypothetical protein